MLSTATAHLLLYPQSSSTPPSISHSADTLLLIPLSSKKKNSTGGFPHAPITSPPLSFPVSLVASSQRLLSDPPFFTFLISASCAQTWKCSLYSLMMFTSIFPCRLSLRTLVYYPSPWCIYERHLKSYAPK